MKKWTTMITCVTNEMIKRTIFGLVMYIVHVVKLVRIFKSIYSELQ